jgi:hypothetical protein
MSEYDRRTGVKRLRVRGFKAVRFAAVLKAAGINILRAVAAKKAAAGDYGRSLCGALSLFKGQIDDFIALTFKLWSKNTSCQNIASF